MKDHTPVSMQPLTASSLDVLTILRMAECPLSAYQILDKADSGTLKAPVQVLPGIEALTRLALVHRIETLNKYVACRSDHPRDAQPVLAICDSCGTVAEFPYAPPINGMAEVLAGRGFVCRQIKVEVAGLCQFCQAEASV
jgi:Fur family zinc uptake transcriptional regulator